jgi:uncharacterized protein
MNEWFIIRQTAQKGRGCFAIKNIPKGTQIIEYKGKRISKKLSDKREAEHRAKGELWIFTLNDKEDIDATRGGNDARFINHSCNPNCEAVNYDDEEVWIESIRDIKTGEELSYDYGFEEPDEDYPCYCGEKNCRGWIVKPEYEFSKGEKEELERKRKEQNEYTYS